MRTTRPGTPVKTSTSAFEFPGLGEGTGEIDLGLGTVPGTVEVGGARPKTEWTFGAEEEGEVLLEGKDEPELGINFVPGTSIVGGTIPEQQWWFGMEERPPENTGQPLVLVEVFRITMNGDDRLLTSGHVRTVL